MCEEFRSGKDSDEGRPLQPFVVGHAAAYLDRYVATQVRLPVTPLHRRRHRRSHRRRATAAATVASAVASAAATTAADKAAHHPPGLWWGKSE